MAEERPPVEMSATDANVNIANVEVFHTGDVHHNYYVQTPTEIQSDSHTTSHGLVVQQGIQEEQPPAACKRRYEKEVRSDLNIHKEQSSSAKKFCPDQNHRYTSACSTVNRSICKSLPVFDKVKHHLKSRLQDVILFTDKISAAGIPQVNPRLLTIALYSGIDPNKEEDFKPSTEKRDITRFDGQQVSVDNLVSSLKQDDRQGHFLGIVGPPGCGKTILSNRLCSCFTEDHLVLHVKFMELNYGDEKLTLQELLLDRQFPDVDQSDCDTVFQWMKKNQEKCVHIFDGLDQATWTLDGVKPVAARYDTPLPVKQLVANLCGRKFFEKSSLILTSRPHSLLSLPMGLRPKSTIYVHDLSTNDMKVLFWFLAGENADALWVKLETKSPQILDFCHNPMLLQFVVFAGLYGDANNLNTLSKIFDAVLQQLGHSQHAKGQRIKHLKKSLGKMAYKGMLRKSVVFTHEDLEEVGLQDVSVQDVVIKFVQYSWFSRCLFDGAESLFYFVHQLLQEIFAAYYIAYYMPIDEFENAIGEVVASQHWAMVRRFLCGILLGVSEGGIHQTICNSMPASSSSRLRQLDGQQDKRETFFKKFEKNLQSKNNDSHRFDFIELLVDLQECSEEVRNKLAKCFPRDLFFTGFPMSSTRCHALADFLPRSDLKLLDMQNCHLNCDKLKIICKGFEEIKEVKLEFLNLNDNNFGKDAGKIISDILGKVSGELWLRRCELDSESKQILEEELRKLVHPPRVWGLSWDCQ